MGIFAGEVDITTPPWMGEHIAETMPNAHAYTVPATGHVAINTCTWSMMADFLDNPSVAPDDACLDELTVSFK